MSPCKPVVLASLFALTACDAALVGDDPSDAGLGGEAEADAGPETTSDAGEPEPLFYENFVLEANGDPDASFFDGAYYLYLPKQVRTGGTGIGGQVIGYRSLDLVEWEPLGEVFNNVDEAYGGEVSKGLWAPEVMAYGGKYYLYYVNVMSGGVDADVGNKDIVVIESDDPTDFHGGTDRKVLLDGDYAFIDPSPFEDPVTGKLALLFKRRNAKGTGTRVRMRPMSDPSTFSGAGEILIESSDLPGAGQVEHPMLYREGDIYYFLFSYGEGDEPTYHIAYATSTTPLGPYTLRGTLFKSDSDLSGDPSTAIIAPGAASIVRDGAGQPWMVYRQKRTDSKTFADRGVCIDRIEFDTAAKTISGTPTKGTEQEGPAF